MNVKNVNELIKSEFTKFPMYIVYVYEQKFILTKTHPDMVHKMNIQTIVKQSCEWCIDRF